MLFDVTCQSACIWIVYSASEREEKKIIDQQFERRYAVRSYTYLCTGGKKLLTLSSDTKEVVKTSYVTFFDNDRFLLEGVFGLALQ